MSEWVFALLGTAFWAAVLFALIGFAWLTVEAISAWVARKRDAAVRKRLWRGSRHQRERQW